MAASTKGGAKAGAARPVKSVAQGKGKPDPVATAPAMLKVPDHDWEEF
jgi:hypothetical protein